MRRLVAIIFALLLLVLSGFAVLSLAGRLGLAPGGFAGPDENPVPLREKVERLTSEYGRSVSFAHLDAKGSLFFTLNGRPVTPRERVSSGEAEWVKDVPLAPGIRFEEVLLHREDGSPCSVGFGETLVLPEGPDRMSASVLYTEDGLATPGRVNLFWSGPVRDRPSEWLESLSGMSVRGARIHDAYYVMELAGGRASAQLAVDGEDRVLWAALTIRNNDCVDGPFAVYRDLTEVLTDGHRLGGYMWREPTSPYSLWTKQVQSEGMVTETALTGWHADAGAPATGKERFWSGFRFELHLDFSLEDWPEARDILLDWVPQNKRDDKEYEDENGFGFTLEANEERVFVVVYDAVVREVAVAMALIDNKPLGFN